jgi:hypothetical protein
MITDARAYVDPIAAFHLQRISAQVAHSDAEIPHTNDHETVQAHDRLALVRSLARSAQGVSIKTDMARAAAALRAAENVAAWRTYLSEDCVIAMVNHGWDFST